MHGGNLAFLEHLEEVDIVLPMDSRQAEALDVPRHTDLGALDAKHVLLEA